MHSNTHKNVLPPSFFSIYQMPLAQWPKCNRKFLCISISYFFVTWRKASQEQLYALQINLTSENNNKVRPESEDEMKLQPNCKRLKD